MGKCPMNEIEFPMDIIGVEIHFCMVTERIFEKSVLYFQYLNIRRHEQNLSSTPVYVSFLRSNSWKLEA